MTATLPDWLHPPRDSGWEADDLDHIPNLPRRTELIDGALVLALCPQRSWHDRVVRRLTAVLEQQAPPGRTVEARMTVRLSTKSRLEPDVVAADVAYDPDRTRFLPHEGDLVVEVVSEESRERDRETKPFTYARAGIRHFWRIEEEHGLPVVHSYELDDTTRAYVATGIHRERVKAPVPFDLDVDLTRLVR
ncbi:MULTISPECIES: Uma2 family endonuclease [Streptomyces]|uniref:Uma2 family endonuclease n=1 Tax=Streptomyces sudanensis TaxID=436397 RepID=A0ABY4TBE1_9ACTN|nr:MULTISPECIES: Uma2 family endonuclease [Streptomyces]URN16287.1 Uma2 family endonuclease [Streptomyces sudanensis]